MYLKEIAIKNIWPISNLHIELPFHENWNPKPIILVWENWTWKTIFESQITDWLYEIWSKLFDDVGKYDGIRKKFYKVSWWPNLQIWKNEWFSILSFFDNRWDKIEYFDKTWTLSLNNYKEYINNFSLSPNNQNDSQKEITSLWENETKTLREEWLKWSYFYQPAYRYEEPFWKNEFFSDQTKFSNEKLITWNLNKDIEVVSSLDDNKSFIMDLVLDFVNNPNDVIGKTTWTNINNVLRKIKKRDDIRFGIWARWNYRISIVEINEQWDAIDRLLPSIDNLSLWESVLLNLFINIIRHWDKPPKLAEDIEWIVVIDEIDIHLHSDLQNSVLPELILMFPKIQFIITTHSPLFLLWLNNILWEWKFEIRNMPNWDIIDVERFSEFKKAYEIMKNTEEFEKWIREIVRNRNKPVVYVEWPTDVEYIKKAYELYWKSTDDFDIEIIWGWDENGNIQYSNNIALKWAERFLKCNLNILNQKVILLNDPEETREIADYQNMLFVRKMPRFEHILKHGIENLFENQFIEDIRAEHWDRFCDIWQESHINNFRISNKSSLCSRICENWTIEDFINFEWIFSIIEAALWN